MSIIVTIQIKQKGLFFDQKFQIDVKENSTINEIKQIIQTTLGQEPFHIPPTECKRFLLSVGETKIKTENVKTFKDIQFNSQPPVLNIIWKSGRNQISSDNTPPTSKNHIYSFHDFKDSDNFYSGYNYYYHSKEDSSEPESFRYADGYSSKTFRSEYIPNGQTFVVKILKLNLVSTPYSGYSCDHEEYDTENDRAFLLSTSQNLLPLNYPTIVKFYGITMDRIGVVMEYVPGQSLSYYLSHTNDQKWQDFTNKFIIILGISLGMRYLHSHNIIHKDLNTDHVVLDSNFYPKIVGFHFVKFPFFVPHVIQFGFMAPEGIEGNGKAAEVFSFAMTIYSVLYNQYPFNERYHFSFSDRRPSLNNDEIQSLNKLINICWHKDPIMRPNFDEITCILLNIKNELIQSGKIEEKRINDFLEYCNKQ